MPPMSMAAIETIGEIVVEEFFPEMFTSPKALDYISLVEEILPARGIHVVPASVDELVDCEAATPPDGDGEINILIRDAHWRALHRGGRQANRARATLIHELAHAVLHVPVVRRRRLLEESEFTLRRVRRDAIPAYSDPEWQAWALAGCIVAPRRAIRMLPGTSINALPAIFGVSEDFIWSHLRRLGKAKSRRSGL